MIPKFDMAKKIMLYLYLKRMGDSGKISTAYISERNRIARTGAIFFCAFVVACVVAGVFFSVSCGHTPDRTEAPVPDVNPLEEHLQKARAENSWLKEENERLCGEIVRLNQELTAANEAIYTLNRKLDAIFNPDLTGE